MFTTLEQKGQVGEFLFFSALPGADYISAPGPTLSLPFGKLIYFCGLLRRGIDYSLLEHVFELLVELEDMMFSEELF